MKQRDAHLGHGGEPAPEGEDLDWLEKEAERQYWEEREPIERQKKLLMKLNKAELVVLAKHYEIKDVQFYTEPHDWKFGGKEELAGEIAERMVL